MFFFCFVLQYVKYFYSINNNIVKINASLFFLFYRTAQQPRAGGRAAVFNQLQEQEICNMVIANNSIRLREIQSAIINDNNVFANINSVSISTIDRVLKRHQMTMKQLYKVPFERNSERVKGLRYQYVQVNHWCALSELSCFSKMPALLYCKYQKPIRKNIYCYIFFLCFFIENHGVRST